MILFSIFPAVAQEYIPTPIDGVLMECGNEVAIGVKWSYCISRTNRSKSNKVIYHLHGRNGKATWWNDKSYHTGKIHKAWIDSKISPPVIISISFGKVWLLLRDESKTGFIEKFINNVIVKMETKLKFKPVERSIMGISMGGLNTLYLSMTNSEIFKKAVILCAHIPFISHHDSMFEILNYIYQHDISLKRAYMMYQMSKVFFPTKRIFELNNPKVLLDNFIVEKSPAFYISCGLKDDWGCMKSSNEISKKIMKKGGIVNWAPREGGHCDLDHKLIASFLAK